ncbi:MAG: YbaK/EbsC family protein [Candidatus Uhrbacteria bacterium]
MTVYEKIIELLNTNEAKYTTEHHEPTVTSEDASRVRGVSMHAGAKALVIHGKKTGTHWLFVIPADLRFDAKKAKAIVGEAVSFAQDPETVTGCVRGSVPPLGSVIGLKTYCDARLAENETIHFNAGSLTDSVSMPYADYLRIENPEIVDISE